MQLKSSHLLKIFAICSHTRAKTSTTLFDCVVIHYHALGPGIHFLKDVLSQLCHILDFQSQCGQIRQLTHWVCKPTLATSQSARTTLYYTYSRQIKQDSNLIYSGCLQRINQCHLLALICGHCKSNSPS